jgi:stress response protein YsnF
MILRGYKSVACKLLKTNRFHAHPCGKQHESWLNSRNGEVRTIISLVEEVLVVEKRWMLREEIHIRTQRLETHQPQRITLRSEDVHVERVPRSDT